MANSKTEKSTFSVNLRLSKAEKLALQAAAKAANTTESEYVRRLIKAANGLPIPVAEASKDELKKANEQLRKVGVNLNQGVRAMNEGRVHYDKAMHEALLSLSDAVTILRSTIGEMLKPQRKRADRAS